jgi:hypothetical protein
MSEWISVKDRMPGVDVMILMFSHPWVETGFLEEEDGGFIEKHSDDYVENVTHWMPLPDAPKDES